jgi:hypothetical protein
MPQYDYRSMKYKYLGRLKDYQVGKEYIARNRPSYAMEFTVVEVSNVPNLSSKAVGMQSHLEARYFLFD